MRAVNQGRPKEHHGPSAFDERLLIHEVPAYIGMYDDRVGRAIRVLDAGHIATLKAVACESEGVLVGNLRNGIALR